MAAARSTEAEERVPLLGPSSDVLAKTSVYPLIHEIRRDIILHIDTPLTWEQLHSPDTTYTVVRPLTDKYEAFKNHATVFCLLLNRVQFIRIANSSLALASLSQARAALCELLTIRLFRSWSERTIELASVLLTPWDLYQGASDEVKQRVEEQDGDDEERVGNALEMAIISKSKRFIKSASCQKVIDGVWSGRVVYSASNSHAIIADNYKRKPTHIYNPHLAPLLDHYRLKVPRVRAVLEYFNFLLLFVLYVIALERSVRDHIVLSEWIFIVYAAGFTLDKVAAMQEHGMQVYSANLWNGFDLVFVLIYLSYVALRFYGLSMWFGGYNDWAASLGNDILAVGACLMFPRFAFVTLSDNLMILALRSMIIEFSILMGIATFCFLGFAYALWTLAKDNNMSDRNFSIGTIIWWMLDIWFGLDASGFNEATNFHPVFGPILIVIYASLSNTLAITVLISILSKTFADISTDAGQEAMFRKAVSTIEGAKSDAVFSYQAPFNLLAVCIMFPAKYILTPRWFHKLNVAMIRASAFPILLTISLYERQVFQHSRLYETLNFGIDAVFAQLPRSFPLVEGLVGSAGEIEQVFEIEEEMGGQRGLWDEDDTDLSDDGWDESAFQPRSPVIAQTSAPPSTSEPAAPSPPHPVSTAISDEAQAPAAPRQPRVTFPSSPSSINVPPSRARRASFDAQRVQPSPLARLFIAPSFPQSQFIGKVGSSMGGIRRSFSVSSHDPLGGHRRAASLINPPLSAYSVQQTTSPIPEERVPLTREQADRKAKRGEDAIGHASDVLARAEDQQEEDGRDRRLREVEKKLEKMTKLLERIVRQTGRMDSPAEEGSGSGESDIRWSENALSDREDGL